MVVFFIVLYFVIGVLMVAGIVYLNKKSKYFNKLFNDTDISYGDSVPDFGTVSFLTTLFWPILLLFYLVYLPFHFINYLDDNGWSSINDNMKVISKMLKDEMIIVDFSVAELMKERGFDKETLMYYEHSAWPSSRKNIEKLVYGDKKKNGNIVYAPTLFAALQWLKKEFGYEIGISYEYDDTMKYVWSVYDRFGKKIDDEFNCIISKDCRYKYSKIDAINEAIKYTLMCVDEKKN